MFEEKPHHRSSPTALAASAAADSLIESVIESGQIGNRLAEEIHNLRSELLQIKQEKRLLIVANRNLQEENNKWIKLAQSNYNTIASDQEEILNQRTEISKLAERLSILESKFQSSTRANKELSEKLRAERLKLRMIGFELEKSLEDEIALKKKYTALDHEHTISKDLLHEQEKQIMDFRIQQSKLKQSVEADQQAKIFIVESLIEIKKAIHSALSQHRHAFVDDSPVHFDPLNSSSAEIDEAIQKQLLVVRQQISRLSRRFSKTRSQLRKLLSVVKSYDDLLLNYSNSPAIGDSGRKHRK